MARMKPKNISEMGGLENYLEQTRELHNQLGYHVFSLCITKRISRLGIGRLYDVNKKTIDKWVNVYIEEKIDE